MDKGAVKLVVFNSEDFGYWLKVMPYGRLLRRLM
jgi:hypothetical protein